MMNNNNQGKSGFTYTYSAKEQEEIKKIRYYKKQFILFHDKFHLIRSNTSFQPLFELLHLISFHL